jgi:hypothetical protein
MYQYEFIIRKIDQFTGESIDARVKVSVPGQVVELDKVLLDPATATSIMSKLWQTLMAEQIKKDGPQWKDIPKY